VAVGCNKVFDVFKMAAHDRQRPFKHLITIKGSVDKGSRPGLGANQEVAEITLWADLPRKYDF
jgi:hypothetical protein